MAEKNYSKLQLFAVLTILIIFPLLSWVYLKAGLDYQRETRAELINYGELPEFRFTNFKGEEFNKDSLKSEMAILSFIGENENCLLYTSPSPRDQRGSRMPSSA